jgi:Holliday junction DNA helicase RuvA
MIATLSGVVAEKLGATVVLETGGIGYGLVMTNEDYTTLEQGQNFKVYVYEYVRENAHDLFGFLQLDTKALFEQLLEVNGVGPRMAVSILSVASADDVRQAIAGGDTAFIQQANGVGKRIAERIVVELKDKVGIPGTDIQATGVLQSENFALRDDAAKALVSLGYNPQDALNVLRTVDANLPTEERIRQALKGAK